MVRLKKDERRKQIIEAATKVFAERGLAGTRTREIAEACGVNEALLYKHFSGKEEVFVEVMEHIHEQFVESWKRAVDEAPDGKSALATLIKLQINTIFSQPDLSSNYLHGLAASTSEKNMHTTFSSWFVDHHTLVTNIIKRGISDGSLRKEIVPERCAWWFRGLSMAALLSSATQPSGSLTEETVLASLNDLIDSIST